MSCDDHKCQVERTQVTFHHPLGRCSNSLHLLFSQGFATNRARCRRFGQRIAFSVTRRSSHAGVDWDRFGDPAFPRPCFRSRRSAARGSIRGDVFTKGTNGEPAVLLGVLIVIQEPITKETESDTKGGFAVDSLPPGTYQIEANAPGLYAALAVAVSADASSTGPVEMNMAAVTSTTSTQLTRLRALDCACSRKVHHHA